MHITNGGSNSGTGTTSSFHQRSGNKESKPKQLPRDIFYSDLSMPVVDGVIHPIKFNGSIFTVDCYNRNDQFKGFDADFRQWGGPYWWQNTRLPYWSMLVSGDFDMMKPLFGMYLNNLPIRKLATKKYYQHDGAYFPETMNFWGTFASENYGCDRTGLADGYTTNPYIRYYWQGGLELSTDDA